MKWLTLFIFFVAVTCFALRSCGPNITEEDALAWFNSHYNELKKINLTLIKSANIQRVDPGLGLKYASNRLRFTHEEVSTYKQLIVDSKKINIIYIQSYKNNATGQPITNTYTLDSTGMIGEGTSISIEHVADVNYLKNRNDEYNEYSYQKINDDGWHLVTYKSQKGTKY